MLHLSIMAVYAAASIGLFVYGTNCYVLVFLFLRCRRTAAVRNTCVIAAAQERFDHPEDLPRVTTQIPVYNEANVVERSLRCAAAIDYPLELHQIQVLDDSTDETVGIVNRVADELASAGHHIQVLRRERRTGFKAGALAAGLCSATGEYVAVFDADFAPPKRFFRDTLPFFLADDRLALVQARWGHLNAAESALTRAQAIAIDGHFMVEQSARTFNGLMMNFNGTAGVWRRVAIEDAGGWTADTLTEDLDLSYRAQLRGWHTHFLSNLEVPGELPASLAAFKSQQFRWAKGSMQTARKLLPQILRSDISTWAKVQAFLHLTHYVIHPLMLVVAVFALPAVTHFSRPSLVFVGVPIAAMGLAILGPNSMYMVGQRTLHAKWIRRMLWLPALTFVGIGMAASNTRAVFEAWIGRPSEFVRTPKRGHGAGRKAYASAKTLLPWIEIAIGLYCAMSLTVFLAAGRYAIGPLLGLYATGFLVTGVAGLAEFSGASVDPIQSTA